MALKKLNCSRSVVCWNIIENDRSPASFEGTPFYVTPWAFFTALNDEGVSNIHRAQKQSFCSRVGLCVIKTLSALC